MKKFNTYFETKKRHPMILKDGDKEIARISYYKLQEHFMSMAKAFLDNKLENKKVLFDPLFNISCFDAGDVLRWTITSKFKEEKC